MVRLRATKYDPKNRDAQGRYLVNEFTSVSDIAKSFHGATLTTDDYMQIEDSYVDCVEQLLISCGCHSLRVSELETSSGGGTADGGIQRLRPVTLGAIRDGLIVEGKEIGNIVRLVLREMIWCKLAGPKGLYVYFGYDMYLYIGANVDPDTLGPPPRGIFYESHESPYS